MDATSLIKAAAVVAGAAYADAKWFIADDMLKIKSLISIKLTLARNNRQDRNSVWYTFQSQVKKNPSGEAYQFEGLSMTWREVDVASRRVAHFLLSKGLKGGDVIALLMDNKLAYPIIWIACLSINVVPAFINSSLTGAGLSHCILVAGARLVLFDADLAAPIADALPLLAKSTLPLQLVQWSDSSCLTLERDLVPTASLVDENILAQMSVEEISDASRAGITWQSPALLIFTSGTTGLPKAANCSHGRIGSAFILWTHSNHFSSSSRIYTPMPLYHSTAALLAIGTSWNSGATVIIGRKFSATKFWDDCRRGNANTIQYVGECLRFLLSTPPASNDKDHNVRLAYGNGARPDVWNKFRNRFGVTIISEFFASTEGNGSLLNYNRNEFGAGAVGAEGLLVGLARRKAQVIVKVDPLTEEPERDAKGFCVVAAPDEDGELLCVIIADSPFQAFAGYHGNKAATQKKILTNVFEKGDAYFRTGDLLRKDANGFSYFSDRLGDTFRWKSENVATTQVAEVLGAVVDNANVYGVLVPGFEGRAGCAAIPAESKLDLSSIAIHVSKHLPKYAQPLFIQVVSQMDSTGTQKQQKVSLRNEGVDPDKMRDPVYWLQNGAYQQFTRSDWKALQAGKVRL